MIALRLFLFALILAAWPARAQVWDVSGDNAAPVAMVCGESGVCLSLGCAGGGPVHYEITLGDTPLDPLLAGIDVDGRPVGTLALTPAPDEDIYRYRAAYDAGLQGDMIARLRAGNRAALILGGGMVHELSLSGSSRAIATVLDTCPEPRAPMPPLSDPAAQVLAQIEADCKKLGGTVTLEPGFERTEDLDGDGRTDMVVDFAAAVCSEMTSLYCGSGGCTVGFYLNRETEFLPIFVDMIRGYDSAPGGLLTLDLHGSFCGVFGYEACLKRFDISQGELVLVNELTGEAAIAVLEGAPLPSLEPPEVLQATDRPVPPRGEAWPDRPATGPGTEVVLAAIATGFAASLPPPETTPAMAPPATAALSRHDGAPVLVLPEANLAAPRLGARPGGMFFAGIIAPDLAPSVARIAPALAEAAPLSGFAPPMSDMPEPPIYPATGESLDAVLLGGGAILVSPATDTAGDDRLGLGEARPQP